MNHNICVTPYERAFEEEEEEEGSKLFSPSTIPCYLGTMKELRKNTS